MRFACTSASLSFFSHLFFLFARLVAHLDCLFARDGAGPRPVQWVKWPAGPADSPSSRSPPDGDESTLPLPFPVSHPLGRGGILPGWSFGWKGCDRPTNTSLHPDLDRTPTIALGWKPDRHHRRTQTTRPSVLDARGDEGSRWQHAMDRSWRDGTPGTQRMGRNAFRGRWVVDQQKPMDPGTERRVLDREGVRPRPGPPRTSDPHPHRRTASVPVHDRASEGRIPFDGRTTHEASFCRQDRTSRARCRHVSEPDGPIDPRTSSSVERDHRDRPPSRIGEVSEDDRGEARGTCLDGEDRSETWIDENDPSRNPSRIEPGTRGTPRVEKTRGGRPAYVPILASDAAFVLLDGWVRTSARGKAVPSSARSRIQGIGPRSTWESSLHVHAGGPVDGSHPQLAWMSHVSCGTVKESCVTRTSAPVGVFFPRLPSSRPRSHRFPEQPHPWFWCRFSTARAFLRFVRSVSLTVRDGLVSPTYLRLVSDPSFRDRHIRPNETRRERFGEGGGG